MKKTEFQQLLEYTDRQISTDTLARPTRDRTLLLGISPPRSSANWTHHVYLEDGHIHSVFYQIIDGKPKLMGHHYGSSLPANDAAWPAIGWFRYYPQYSDLSFCKEYTLKVQDAQFLKWEEPEVKGPFFGPRAHEMEL